MPDPSHEPEYTPRTFRLSGEEDDLCHEGVCVHGEHVEVGEEVEVIEAAPVLDLIDKSFGAHGPIDRDRPCRLCGHIDPAHYCGPQLEAKYVLEKLLKAYGRLQ